MHEARGTRAFLVFTLSPESNVHNFSPTYVYTYVAMHIHSNSTSYYSYHANYVRMYTECSYVFHHPPHLICVANYISI